MASRIKRTFLCLVSAALLAVSGQTFAVEDDTAESEVSEETVQTEEKADARARETVEKVNCESGYITEYLKKTGSVSGYDVYVREKKFDAALWEKNGGKPAKKSDYTDKQKELDRIITELKRLGDLTIVESSTGEAKATFKDSSKCDEGKLWVSESERYLLTADSESNKPLKLMEVISSIDDPYLYISDDGKTLEQTDKKQEDRQHIQGQGH